jgi:hypothetical protein
MTFRDLSIAHEQATDRHYQAGVDKQDRYDAAVEQLSIDIFKTMDRLQMIDAIADMPEDELNHMLAALKVHDTKKVGSIVTGAVFEWADAMAKDQLR